MKPSKKSFPIYTPHEFPGETLFFITIITFIGLIGGYFINPLILVFALLSWIIFTAIQSYRQFKKKSIHKWNSVTEILLHPQLRFFIFVFLATLGILAVLRFNNITVGMLVLCVWWFFSLNFYYFYKDFKKFE